MTGLSEERAREVLLQHVGKNRLTAFGEANVIRAMLAFAAEQQAGGWRGIESAPKDGTPILVFHGYKEMLDYDAARWRREQWMVHTEDGWWSIDYSPTHWQTLPTPPTEDARHG